MLRIISPCVQNGAVSERLVSLDGSGREFIRTGSNLASCYLPDKRTVPGREPSRERVAAEWFPPTINDQTASFYDLKEVTKTRARRTRHAPHHCHTQG